MSQIKPKNSLHYYVFGQWHPVITSSYYHWQPNNWGVFIDRLSIVFSVVGLTGLVASRHISKLSGYATSIIGVIFGFLVFVTGILQAIHLPKIYVFMRLCKSLILFPIILMISPKKINALFNIIFCLLGMVLGRSSKFLMLKPMKFYYKP